MTPTSPLDDLQEQFNDMHRQFEAYRDPEIDRTQVRILERLTNGHVDPNERVGLMLGELRDFNIDQLYPEPRKALALAAARVIGLADPLSDEQLIEAAQNFPEVVPAALQRGANPQAARDGVPQVMLQMMQSATALCDNYQHNAALELLLGVMRAGTYPLQVGAGQEAPLVLAQMVYDCEQNPWILDVVAEGLALSAHEANMVLVALTSLPYTVPAMTDLAVSVGGDVWAQCSANAPEAGRIIDLARKHRNPGVVALFERYDRERQARELQDTSPGGAGKPSPRRM